ncbi:class I fructose-bisphosphate aldolase [Cryptosporangium sp. NPDC051539]|uniref:class I fructose-bisphosphate aldolase n=1 Tax=Cryptosporangium sp. NPDC051539 TaxID=3363962 RepID=UPI00378D924E
MENNTHDADLGPQATAARLVAPGRGILAADESIRTMSQRLAAEGVEPTAENRRAYRELLVTADGLGETVAGVIFCDETLGSTLADGTPFGPACLDRGILPGIKVDTGTMPDADGVLITQGLDGLDARLEAAAGRGAAFAKWRAVIAVDSVRDRSLRENAAGLARYAAACQAHGVTPIVEPEVLCSGAHGLRECADVTEWTLTAVFEELDRCGVDLAGIVLKPNMVTPGLDGPPATASAVAEATLGLLGSFVPATVPGIAFLSGGHTNATACEYLAEINALGTNAPWALTYSFGRALVSDALHAWAQDGDTGAAQKILLANCARASASLSQR